MVQTATRLSIVIGILLVPGCAADVARADAPPDSHDYLIHLPGIAGERSIDHSMVRGLREGGFDGHTEIYDWTGNDPGIGALLARKRNDAQAQHIADRIVAIEKADPLARVVLTSHSGGTGLAIWALEKLPAGVKVQSLFLLSSALSPQYDLSEALHHVRGNAYAFNSENDLIVLGTGTRMFGTIDGVKCAAAGQCGFIPPAAAADPSAYERLLQRPYDKEWMRYGNDGDHIGNMSRAFARNVLAPVVIRSTTEQPESRASTQPAATRPADAAAPSAASATPVRP